MRLLLGAGWMLAFASTQGLSDGGKPFFDPFAIPPHVERLPEEFPEPEKLEVETDALDESGPVFSDADVITSAPEEKIEVEKATTKEKTKWIRRYYLHLNGYSIHFDKQPDPGETVNDYLLGLGGAVEFDTKGPLIWDISLDVFNDSNEEISVTFGPTVQYPLADWLGIGAAGFIMYKEAFQRDYNFPILPVPLPFLEGKTKYVHLRMFYIPPVRRSTDEQLVFQLRIPF